MSATCTMSLTAMLVAMFASVQVSAYYSEAEKDMMDIMKIIMKPRKPERFSPDLQLKNTAIVTGTGDHPKILQFSYSDCGSSADSLRIHNIKLTPDPLVLPGQLGVTFNMTNNRTATGPIQVRLTVYKKVVFWIEVPCIENVGSCTYADICQMLPKDKSKCPPNLVKHHVPCTCPLPKGQYNLPLTKFRTSVKGVPGGDYKLQAQFTSREGPLACLNVMFSIA